MRLVLRTSLILLVFSLVGLVQAVTVKGVRMWPAPDHTRLVFDLSSPVQHSLFVLKSPNRLVIDLKYSDFRGALPALNNDAFIKHIRYAKRGVNDLRVVLDLKRAVSPKSFVLKPHGGYGDRLVVDLIDTRPTKERKPVRRAIDIQGSPRDVIIAIDAGHGGDDPGAIGHRGTKEKDVVLGIAKRLKKLIDKQPGMKAKMIRTGDYFISLKKRVTKARNAQADLFISIHADAFKDQRAHGSSVFVLSEHGASSEVASFLARSENNSDLIGGVSLENKDPLLKRVLVDMLKDATLEESHDAAKHLIKGLKGVTRLHKKHVEQAGFRVLKAPDIPSVLIETAFISNRKEERKLRSGKHQQKLARAIFKGTLNYFKSNPPPGTLIALQDRKHRIASGDTLSNIAQRYQVSMADIRRVNGMTNNELKVGKTLRIPGYLTNDS